MLTRIETQHREIAEQIRAFNHLMARGETVDRQALLAARVCFSRAYRTHLGEMNRCATAWLATASDPATRKVVSDHLAEHRRLQTLYSGHLQTWTPAAILQDEEAYKAAVRTLQSRLLAIFEREAQIVLPLLSFRHAA